MSRKLSAIRQHGGRLAAGLAFFAVFIFMPGAAHAVSQDITATPTSASPYIQPGGVYHGKFQVLNQGKSGYRFLVYAAPYDVDSEAYTPDFTALPTAPNITGWFNFSAPGGYINAGQTQTINYTISVPENTQPGGYYAAIFAETQYPKSANGITLNERVGEIVYVQAAGHVVKKGELLTWQSNFFQKPPLTSTIRLQNDGSIHYQSNVQLEVKDILGHTKFRLTADKELLPQTIRRVSIPWAGSPGIGLFKVSGSVSFLGHNHPLGTKWVLVMSDKVRLIILAIVVLAILFAAAKFLYHRRKARTARKRSKAAKSKEAEETKK